MPAPVGVSLLVIGTASATAVTASVVVLTLLRVANGTTHVPMKMIMVLKSEIIVPPIVML